MTNSLRNGILTAVTIERSANPVWAWRRDDQLKLARAFLRRALREAMGML